MKNRFESANKYYNHFVSSEVFYNFQNSFLITDGIFEIAGEEECFWFLKIIADAQEYLKNFPLQNWVLGRVVNNEFLIKATDIEGKIIFEKRVLDYKFFFNEFVVCISDSLIMLPSEYKSATRTQLKITANPYYLKYQLVNIDVAKRIV
ncbi:DUF6876 family protein [Chryseobacterium nematophagum]|nr:DUF6876 family protein [Chryseobacterium nematophagum]